MPVSNEFEQNKFRTAVYGVLALAFSAPQTLTDALYADMVNAYTSLRAEGDPVMIADDSENSRVLGLNGEHLRLFVGPGHIQCSPYESSHRKDRPEFERGLVMGPSTAYVQRRYAEAGLGLSKEYTDLPDHIAVEMDFMRFLCIEESRFLQEGNLREAGIRRKMQQEFLKDHLKPWVEAFADCVIGSTTSPFYKAAGNLLKVFMKNEYDYLLGSATE